MERLQMASASKLLVALALVLATAVPAAAQRQAVSQRDFDASRKLLRSDAPISRFRATRIVISELNPVCFTYERQLSNTTVALDAPTALTDLLGITKAAGTSGDEESGKEGEGGEKSTFSPNFALPIDPQSAGAAKSRRADRTLPAAADTLKERIIAAQAAIARAHEAIGEANARIQLAGADAKRTAEAACDPDTPFRTVRNSWNEAFARHTVHLTGAREEIESARELISTARRHLGEASVIETRLSRTSPAYANALPIERSLAQRLSEGLTDVAEAVIQLEEGRAESSERLLSTSAALHQANVSMAAADTLSTLAFEVYPTLMEEKYDVKLVATPRPQEGKDPGKPEETSFSVRVRPGVLFRMTAGIAFSALDAPIYRRVNLPHPDSAGKTYSTFDLAEREKVSYAPMLQANMMYHVGPLPIGPSVGAAAREVRGTKGLDYMVGLTAGLADHVFITGGRYAARRERLRLGDLETVRAAPVPASVTDADAVRIERRWAWGFAVSFRN